MIRSYRVTVKMRQNVITSYVQANENVLFESRKWENQWEGLKFGISQSSLKDLGGWMDGRTIFGVGKNGRCVIQSDPDHRETCAGPRSVLLRRGRWERSLCNPIGPGA